MLKGIAPVISPDLLADLSRMGHGDEVVLADAHFPAHSLNEQVHRSDGVRIPHLLEGILPLFELDTCAAPLIMMAATEGDTLDPKVEEEYMQVITQFSPETTTVRRIERFQFYERSKSAFAIVLTGEIVKYGNIILKKGVTPAD